MSEHIADRIIRGLIPAVVALSFVVFRKYLPSRKGENTKYDDIEASGEHAYVNAAMALAVILVAATSFFLLLGANRAYARLDGPALRTVLPGKFIWWFFPLFASLTLAPIAVLRVWSLGGRQHAAKAYERWSDEKASFRSFAVLRWMALFITIPLGIFSLLSVPRHASFFENEMTVGRFAQLRPEHRPYDSIRRFATIDGFQDRDGHFHTQPTILLQFDDGSEWRSWTLTEDNELDTDLVNLLTEKLNHQPDQFRAELPGNH